MGATTKYLLMVVTALLVFVYSSGIQLSTGLDSVANTDVNSGHILGLDSRYLSKFAKSINDDDANEYDENDENDQMEYDDEYNEPMENDDYDQYDYDDDYTELSSIDDDSIYNENDDDIYVENDDVEHDMGDQNDDPDNYEEDGGYYSGYYFSGDDFANYDDLNIDDYPFLDDEVVPSDNDLDDDEYYAAGNSESPDQSEWESYDDFENSYYYSDPENMDDDDDFSHSNKLTVDSGDDSPRVKRLRRNQRGVPLWSYAIVAFVSVGMACCAAGFLQLMLNQRATRDSYKFKALSTNDDVEMVNIDEDDADV